MAWERTRTAFPLRVTFAAISLRFIYPVLCAVRCLGSISQCILTIWCCTLIVFIPYYLISSIFQFY